jgi:Leucine-rich repeat (LRR) protein
LINQQFNHLINGRLWVELCRRDYLEYYDGLTQDTHRTTYILCHGLNKLKSISEQTIEIDKLYKGTSIIVDDFSIGPNRSWVLRTLRTEIVVCRMINEINMLKNITALQYVSYNSVPTWIGDMTNLKSITLDNNDTTDFPKDLCRLNNLEELCLGFNRLEDLPKEMEQMTGLRKLYLNHNRLFKLPLVICKLINLETLALEYNDLIELPPKIGNMANLRYLSFTNNHVTQLPLEILKLTKLEVLSCINNAIKEVPIEISRMPNLKTYHI